MKKTRSRDLAGVRSGRLVAVKRVGTNNSGGSLWQALCDCGRHTVVCGSSIRRAKTRSCGCLARDLNNAKKSVAPENETRKEKRNRIESINYLRDRFSYSPETGLLEWKNGLRSGRAGAIVKPRKSAGPFVKLSIEGLDFKAHRVIWVMMTGERPPDGLHVDHIDGDPTNNRWSNLRVCAPKENARNSKRPKSNTSGLKGVSLMKNGKYRAFICVDRKQIHLGCYDDPASAHQAYINAAHQHFKSYACIDR